MEKLLTTKDLSAAIGVSESSLRRWTDSGAIGTSRTPGGHRRIPLSEAVRFIRDTHATVIKPEILGLPDVGPASGVGGSAAEMLHSALLEGDAAKARGQVTAMYLNGMSVAAICDGPIRNAMQRIGELWRHEASGILIEHRATDICIGAVGALRQLLPEPSEIAPLAIGGTPAGDPYMLPSSMAAVVVAEAGWREANFGPRVPLELLADAAHDRDAGLVWLSISFIEDSAALRKSIKKLAGHLAKQNRPLLIGGRCVDEVVLAKLDDVHVMRSMSELSAFARGAARSKTA